MVIRSSTAVFVSLLAFALVIAPLPAIVAPLTPVAAAQVTSAKTGSWSTASTWSCNCIPGAGDVVKIASGHTVTIGGTRSAASLTVEGTLKASRTESSTLSLNGNLVVKGSGVLDYGSSTSPIPDNVTSRIRWSLNEASYVGGLTMVPLASDVGLWVVEQGKVFTNGPDRGAWTLLTATASKGVSQVTVDPKYAAGWRAGDVIVLGPSNAPPQAGPMLQQDELRTIVSVNTSGTVTLNTPLLYDHKVEQITWTDTFGDTYTERLAPPVANLTRNIVFEAANPLHRPHAMIMDAAVVDLADVAFVAFGPKPKNIGKFSNGQFKPFGRYAVHFHLQKDASRASKLESVLITGGAGRGLNVHDSYGVTAYDVVVYDQAHTNFLTGLQAFWLEEALHNTSGEQIAETGAHDLWLDRPLALKFGIIGGVRATGLHFGPGRGAQIVGAHAAEGIGSLASGMFWPGSTPCVKGDLSCTEDPNRGPRGFRLTAQTSAFGFSWWNNSAVREHVVDMLGWNSSSGIDLGAYVTRTELFQVRLIGNTNVQDAHHTTGYKSTGFLLDGRNAGGIGILVRQHAFTSTTDDLFENGVIRGVGTALAWECAPGENKCGTEVHTQLARVRFEGNPLLSFVWHSDKQSSWRIRSQEGLLRAPNFTLYRTDQAIPGSVLDAAYGARRVDNDASGTAAPPPRVRLVQGGGCVADEAVVTGGSVTVCAETDAPTVEFYSGKDLIAKTGGAHQSRLKHNTA